MSSVESNFYIHVILSFLLEVDNMVNEQNENINLDSKILKALDDLKELLEKDQFQNLKEIINYTRNNPIIAGVSYFFIDDKIDKLNYIRKEINSKQKLMNLKIINIKLKMRLKNILIFLTK